MKEIEEKFRKLFPIVKRKADLFWLYYLFGQGKERFETDELIDILLFQKLRKDYKKKILLEPPKVEKLFGEYPLGIVIYPDKPYGIFGLNEEEWTKHICIVGMTGVGKTNLVFQILKEFKKKNKPFLVFDWKKNYRDLLQLNEFKDIKVYTVGRELIQFKFNPLIPPKGTDPGQWLMRLIDIIKHAYFLGEGVEYLLRQAIDFLYEKNGVYKGSLNFPILSEVKEFISKKDLKGRMMLWQASTLRTLASLTFKKGLGMVLDVKESLDPKELLENSIILELDALSDIDKVFFTEVLILWIYEYRKNEGKREQFKHALIIEEAHHILSKRKEKAEVETIIETSLRQIREFGESVIIVDQEPQKLSESIKANTYTKISFNLGNGKDIQAISKDMNLTKEQESYLDLLQIGQAIIKLKGRFYQPIFVAFPLLPIQKGFVSDERIKVL
ncbi:MAG: ATP-binding protein [Methanosarcinales archaeon]